MDRDTDLARKDWYQLVAPAAAYNWPETLTLDDYELVPYEAKVGPTRGGAPTIYRKNVLTAGADEVRRSPGHLVEISSALEQEFSWSIALAARGTGETQEVLLEIAGSATSEPDAWVALQFLQRPDGVTTEAADLVRTLSLVRLSFIGMPAKEGHAGTCREAVEVMAPAPRSRLRSEVPGGRRPVVALLDSGVGSHHWLGTADPNGSDERICIDAADLGFVPVGPALPPRSTITSLHAGELETHAGHGTFIAGLIRQLAPDAQVLSMHVMHGDGVLEEGAVMGALQWLLGRVRRAADDPSLFVDVICLSFGYYEQQPVDSQTADLRCVLGELGSLGVRVVASAGNHHNDSPVYPAAFAGKRYASEAPRTRLISVGALNPDGSRAAYSNYGSWVRWWEVGTALMSTMPVFGKMLPAKNILEYQPEHLVAGFATWGGTSFSAAVLAGRLARALVDNAAHDGADSMLDMSVASAHRRAARAFKAVRRT